jgi:ketosteroid isomerase-like protein
MEIPMRSLQLLTAILATLIHVVPCQAQERREVPPFTTYGSPASTRDAAAIDTLLGAYRRAWSDQDVGALMALHSEDVEWINAYARMFRGRAALGGFLQHRLFPAFDQAVSKREMLNVTMVSRRYIGNDAVVVHFYTDGDRGASRVQGELLRRTHLHLVLGRQNGRWVVVHTAIMDAR